MGEIDTVGISVTASELALLRTALKVLLSTLGREEADEIDEAQALLAKLDAAG